MFWKSEEQVEIYQRRNLVYGGLVSDKSHSLISEKCNFLTFEKCNCLISKKKKMSFSNFLKKCHFLASNANSKYFNRFSKGTKSETSFYTMSEKHIYQEKFEHTKFLRHKRKNRKAYYYFIKDL
jgi:hypothetical protein